MPATSLVWASSGREVREGELQVPPKRLTSNGRSCTCRFLNRLPLSRLCRKADFVVMEQVEPEIVTREELERDANESARRRPDEEEEDEDDGEGEPNPLVLDHCEAFFLSYALGCLVVSDAGEELDLGCNTTSTSVPLQPSQCPKWKFKVHEIIFCLPISRGH